MAKRVRDADLESRAARGKLKASGKPYYRGIGSGLHLGYRKGDAARRWVVRRYAGAGKYVVEVIGEADDLLDADGTNVLTFWQAQERARGLVKAEPVGPYTVKQAVDDYVSGHLEGKATCRDTRQRLDAYLPNAIADKPVDALVRQDLVDWHRSMVRMAPRLRTKKGVEPRRGSLDLDDPEVIRRRRVSANRVLTKLKAALNFAFKEGKVSDKKAWDHVQSFQNVNVSRTRYLSVAEAKRLINACEPDFRLLVQAALQTGCRYQELARLRCSDFNPDSGTLLVRVSKAGSSRHVVLTDEGAAFFSQLVAGQTGDELLLGRTWLPSNQTRPMGEACARAKIEPRITFHGLRHTWASLAVMSGMPLMVVARNLGHVNTLMVEKHYGHLSATYVQDEVRKHAPKFGLELSNVTAVR
jgi:integrase